MGDTIWNQMQAYLQPAAAGPSISVQSRENQQMPVAGPSHIPIAGPSAPIPGPSHMPIAGPSAHVLPD